MISDPEILYKSISHLLNNAIKFTEKRSELIMAIISVMLKLSFLLKITGINESVKNQLTALFDHFVKRTVGHQNFQEGSGAWFIHC